MSRLAECASIVSSLVLALIATMTIGKTVEADPQAWKILDGKRYLFSSIKVKEAADLNSSA